MKRTAFPLTVGAFLLALAAIGTWPAEGQEPADQLRLLRAENQLLKTTVAQRDETIEALKKKIVTLKAEPARVELKKVRKELAEARARIQQLSKELEQANPVEKKGVKVTDRDLTPKSVKKTDYRGAELLLDGYVVDTRAKEGEFRAVIAAGSDSPQGSPVMVRTQREGKRGVDYQIQVHVTGELAATLRAGDLSRRVRGIIREIKVENGDMFRRTGLSYLPQTDRGVLIIVVLEDISVE